MACVPTPIPHKGGDKISNMWADSAPEVNNAYPGMDYLVIAPMIGSAAAFDAVSAPDLKAVWDVKVPLQDDEYPNGLPSIRSMQFYGRMDAFSTARLPRVADACGYEFFYGVALTDDARKNSLLMEYGRTLETSSARPVVYLQPFLTPQPE